MVEGQGKEEKFDFTGEGKAMICQQCQAQLMEGAKFCSECAAPVPVPQTAFVCQRCQSILVEGSKFCSECAAPVLQLQPQAGEMVEKFEFNATGEAVNYITLDQAVLQARRLARENDIGYCQRLGWREISWSERTSERREDSLRVVLQFHLPVIGVREEHIGQEEFLFDLTGILLTRQVLVWPVTEQEQAGAKAQEAEEHISRADYQGAIERSSEVIRLDPNFALAYFHRAFAYHRLGEQVHREDMTDTKSGKIQVPSAFDAPRLSNAALHNYQQAIQDYTKGIQLNPNNAWGYNNRGLAYQQLGEGPKASEDLNKGRSLGSG